jgi:hypothetical protein
MIFQLGERRTSHTSSRPQYRPEPFALVGFHWTIPIATAALLILIIGSATRAAIEAELAAKDNTEAEALTPVPTIPKAPDPVAVPTIPKDPEPVVKKPEVACQFIWIGGCKYLRCKDEQTTMTPIDNGCVPKDAEVSR